MNSTSHTELRWFVDKESGAWVLQFRTPVSDWAKIPVVFNADKQVKS